jgi:hypothetical protein
MSGQEPDMSWGDLTARQTKNPALKRQWLSWAGVVTAGFTTLCCLGVSAALSLVTALGATFLTRDSALRPILAATLAVTIAGSALSYWRHRRPGPLVLTTLAAVWVYSVVFVVGTGHGGHADAGHGDHMADHMVEHGAKHGGHGFTGGRLALVWVGLAALVAAQVWDLVRVRRGPRKAAIESAP